MCRLFGLIGGAAALAFAVLLPVESRAGERMERIVTEKLMKLGFRTDAAPFSWVDNDTASGFSVELCVEIGKEMKRQLGLDTFSANLVRVDTTDRFDAISRGDIDLLCGATTATLKRRETIGFSIPIFLTGVSAVVSPNASELLREILVAQSPAALSGAATTEALKDTRLGVRTGTTAEDWLVTTDAAAKSGNALMAVSDHIEGVEAVAAGELDAYFADKAILAATVQRAGLADKVLLSTKTFTYEPYAIALPRGDEDLRLAVDRALSHIYASGQISQIFTRYFGKPTPEVAFFYSAVQLPE